MKKVNANRLKEFVKKVSDNKVKKTAIGLSFIVALGSMSKKANAAEKTSDKNLIDTENTIGASNSKPEAAADFNEEYHRLNKQQSLSVYRFLERHDAGIELINKNNRWMISIYKEKHGGGYEVDGNNLNPLGVAILKNIDPKAHAKLTTTDGMEASIVSQDIYYKYSSAIAVKASFIDPSDSKEVARDKFERKIIEMSARNGHFITYDKKGRKILDTKRLKEFRNQGKKNNINRNLFIVTNCRSSRELGLRDAQTVMREINNKNRNFRKGVSDVDNTLNQLDGTLKDVSKTVETIGKIFER